MQYIAGGATQNSIRVAQWMLQDPGHTGFLGAIGSDDFGGKLAACAKEDGVDAHYYVDPTTPTGTCAVLVNSGDRSLVANLAAANKFQPSHLDTPKAKEMLESARFYYIAGFFLTVSVDAILQVAKPAAQSGKVRACFVLWFCFVVVWLGALCDCLRALCGCMCLRALCCCFLACQLACVLAFGLACFCARLLSCVLSDCFRDRFPIVSCLLFLACVHAYVPA